MPLTFYDHERRSVFRTPLEALNGELRKVLFVVATEVDPATLAQYSADKLVLEVIPFGDTSCVVGHRHLTFVRPSCAGSHTSDARYWIVHPLDTQTLFLLQYLPPHRETSVHWHLKETESFCCLLGRCTLIEGLDPADGGGRGAMKCRWHQLDAQGPVQEMRVEPCVVHQLTTGSSPALNGIVIEGTAARTLKELDHRYTHWRKRRRTS